VEELIDVVCVLAYTLPTQTARWCYEVPLRAGYRNLSCLRTPPMGRVPSSAITPASCLSARPTEDLGDPPRERTGSDGRGNYGVLLELAADAMIRTVETRASIY